MGGVHSTESLCSLVKAKTKNRKQKKLMSVLQVACVPGGSGGFGEAHLGKRRSCKSTHERKETSWPLPHSFARSPNQNKTASYAGYIAS